MSAVEFVTLAPYCCDKKTLAEAVAGRSSPLRASGDPIQLTLGIKKNGKPDILITRGQLKEVVANSRLPQPSQSEIRLSTTYESLSPILFYEAEELAKKLSALSKQSTKKRVVNEEDGVSRAVFEHGRSLYYILKDKLDPTTYGLPRATCATSLKVFSLAFNTRGRDTRPSGERLLHPMLLDIGWSEATIPDISLKPGSAKHFLIYEHRYMNQGSQSMEFEHGNTEQLASADISAKLKVILGEQTRSTREPIILLVHDEPLARNALRDLGIDASTWESGLKGLLGYSTLKRESYRNRSGVKREEDEYRNSRRSRSPSPKRSLKPDPDGPYPYNSRSYDYPRRMSPPRWRDGRMYAPVYVLGLKQLYVKMMRMEDGAGSVVEMAQRFNFREEGINKWCAGNEAVLLIRIWHSMISGPAIDEHRTAWDAGWVQAPAPTQPSQLAAVEDEDDEDRDPNDIIYDEATAKAESADRPKAGMYESDSDSD
ncbi:hypothetical protein APHAL10511_005713 [Amanita phalloides]|nr:hypothetical protein APHAL10511_005713 [Amanita phalloides]